MGRWAGERPEVRGQRSEEFGNLGKVGEMEMQVQGSGFKAESKRRRILVFFAVVFLVFFLAGCAGAPETSTQNREGDAEMHFALGRAYCRKGLLDEAAQEWKSVLSIDPGHKGARFNLGLISGDKGFLDEAILNYEKEILTNPDDAMAHYNLGLAYRCSGRPDEAIYEYKKAVAINSGSANFKVSLHNNLGFAYSEKDMFKDALTEYMRALAISPEHGRTHYNLAVAYYRKGEYAMSILHYDKAGETGYAVRKDFLELLEPYRK